MPINKYLNDPSIGADAAKVMSDAYETVLNAIATRGIRGVSTAAIAQKLSRLVHEGETDIARLTEAILEGLRPTNQ